MYKKFEALSEEKRLRIINSAYSEFSKNLFKDASTDEIAINAKISKGALFQYFGSKKQLYFYVYNYGYNILLNEIWEKIDLSNSDLLVRLKNSFLAKMNLYFKYPDLFEFILNSYVRETDKEIKNIIADKIDSQKPEVYAKVITNADYSKLKKEFDPQKVTSIILWTFEGYANAEVTRLKQEKLDKEKYEHWKTDFEQYIDIFRKIFYEEENQND